MKICWKFFIFPSQRKRRVVLGLIGADTGAQVGGWREWVTGWPWGDHRHHHNCRPHPVTWPTYSSLLQLPPKSTSKYLHSHKFHKGMHALRKHKSWTQNEFNSEIVSDLISFNLFFNLLFFLKLLHICKLNDQKYFILDTYNKYTQKNHTGEANSLWKKKAQLQHITVICGICSANKRLKVGFCKLSVHWKESVQCAITTLSTHGK